MRLIEYKKYQTIYGEMIYTGLHSGSNFTCDLCHKERWKSHEFVLGQPDNPNQIYHLGTECVKKWVIKIQED